MVPGSVACGAVVAGRVEGHARGRRRDARRHVAAGQHGRRSERGAAAALTRGFRCEDDVGAVPRGPLSDREADATAGSRDEEGSTRKRRHGHRLGDLTAANARDLNLYK